MINVKLEPTVKSFICCEDLFPKWKRARQLLTFLVDNTNDWKIDFDKSRLNISANYPGIIKTIDSGVEVAFDNMVKTFPENIRNEVVSICNSVIQKHVPNMDKYLHLRINIHMKDDIISKLGNFTPVKNDLYFNLGILNKGSD